MITLKFRIKKYLPLLFTIFISTIFLSNCVRLPKPSIKNKTILVVKDEFVNTSKLPPQMRMKFNIKSSNGLVGNFYVMPSNGNAIISSLEPGNYNINGYTLHAVGTETPRKLRTYSFNTKFELKKNQITVLNRKIVAVQKPYDSRGGWRFNVKTKSITDSEKQEVINLLRKDENFSLWSIYEEKKYAQKPKPVLPKKNLEYDQYCDSRNFKRASSKNTIDSYKYFLKYCKNTKKTSHIIATQKLAALQEEKRLAMPKDFCTGSFFNAANNENTVKSYKKFLDYCSDKTSYWYLTATRELEELQKQKEPEPEPEPAYSSVVLPKVIASPPKVSDQSEKSQTIIIPTGSLGKITENRKKILEKTLESKLDDYFDIVPKELFEEAQEQVFQDMDSDECTEEQCIAMIQEILQVPNAFQLTLITDEGDTQISLTWNDMEKKRVEENYCEDCKTRELRKMIEGLVDKLVGR